MTLDIQKLQLKPAYRVITEDLRQRIVSGRLKQGDALPTETDLATRFGVHRSTIREGLRQLEQDGLVRRDGKRLIVSMPRHSDLASSAERSLRLRNVSLLDVFQVALVLEPLCASLAASVITGEELDGLEHNLAQTAAIVDAGGSPVDIDIEFQLQVAQATRNQALLLARAPINRLMHAGYAAIAPRLPQSGPRLLAAHREVVAALRRHDAEAAESWTRKHMLDYRRGCEVAGLDMREPLPQV
jgi:DNA-binding FadR family transcriptional regulator